MTPRDGIDANASATHFAVEDFRTYAEQELAAAPYWRPGVCLRPECSASFAPKREWQVYCSDACRKADAAEFRKIGNSVALPLLLHRTAPKLTGDVAVDSRTRAARRFVWRVQSAWLADRNARGGGS